LAGHVAVWRGREVCTVFWWGNLWERDNSEDTGFDERIILRWIFKTWDGKVSTGFMRLRTGTGGGLL